MKISKSYSRNLNLGNYQSARIGIELEKEINDNPSKEKLKIISNKLLEVSKGLVNEELEQLKQEVEK